MGTATRRNERFVVLLFKSNRPQLYNFHKDAAQEIPAGLRFSSVGGINMWWVYALLSALFAALTAVLAKVGIKGVDADLATAVRTVMILLIAWGIVLVKNGGASISTLTRNNLLFLGLSGIATGLSWIFYFRALQIGKVSYVAPVDKASVAIAIILSVLFLQETVTIKMLIGTLLVIAGTIIIIL